ncbi:MAG: hypothetical protein AABZ53_04180 [Planctomycetota bacterium]
MSERPASDRRRWFKATSRLLGILACGLAISVLVAQACVLWSEPHPSTEASRSVGEPDPREAGMFGHPRVNWTPAIAPIRTPDPNPEQLFQDLEREADSSLMAAFESRPSQRSERVVTDRGLGLQVQELQLGSFRWLHEVLVLRAGVPFPCMEARQRSSLEEYKRQWPRWEWAVPRPDFIPWSHDRRDVNAIFWTRVLLLDPIWKGLALNTAIYSAGLWVLLTCVRLLRDRFRIAAGCCVVCRYSLEGLQDGAACPECGSTRGRVAG